MDQLPETLAEFLLQHQSRFHHMPIANVAKGDLELKPSEWGLAQENAKKLLAFLEERGIDIYRFKDVQQVAKLDGNPKLSIDELASYLIGLDISANAYRGDTQVGVKHRASITDTFEMSNTKPEVALPMAKEAFGDNRPDASLADTSTNVDFEAGMQKAPVKKE